MLTPTGPRYRSSVPTWFDPLLALFHVDFNPPRRQPLGRQVVAATVCSVVGSLVADAILVKIGTTMFPATRGYTHFRFSDYATLTVIGVLIACAAWPVTTRISSRPRWLFFRMAIAVVLVLWLPDLYILVQGQPFSAVAILMVMHLAIALVTYNFLVRVARTGRRRPGRMARAPDPLSSRTVRVR